MGQKSHPDGLDADLTEAEKVTAARLLIRATQSSDDTREQRVADKLSEALTH